MDFENSYIPFSREEALELWSWILAGWANSLDAKGARTHMDGVPNYADAGGSFEGVTRMLWGLGSWLSYPHRPKSLHWQGKSYDLEALTYRAYVNGCDPQSLSYWGQGPYNADGDQRTVETGQVAFALWQSRDRIWNRMSSKERDNVANFLNRFGQRPSQWGSNWALFWVLNHTSRKTLGMNYDQSIIDDVMNDYLDGVYCGDGWYDDAAKRGANYFDDYNTWVFASHVLAWSVMDGDSMPQRRDELLERVQAWMEHYPYFFAADGAYCEFGRSGAYKFSRLGAAIWAYKLGCWSHSVGMLKRLVGKHLRWYVDRGAIRPDGSLRQSLTATGSPEIIERYISTGATYWAMQAFSGLWSLTDDDPFWTVEEDALPIEQGDFKKVFPQAGCMLIGQNGQVQRYNAGSVKRGYGGKYSKLLYSTLNPYNVGLDEGKPSIDSCLCLTEAGIRGQRESNLNFAVGDDWLRMHYTIELNAHQHHVDTTIIPLGSFHLRAHRILLDDRAHDVFVEEGSAPLGYDAGAIPLSRTQYAWTFAEVQGRIIGASAILGYTNIDIRSGNPNAVYGHNLLIALTAPIVDQHSEFICLVYAGELGNPEQFPVIESAHWEANDEFNVTINDKFYIIPPLTD